jgi:hypothetical protein
MNRILLLLVMVIAMQEHKACDQCSVVVGSGVISEGHFIGYRLKYRRQFKVTNEAKSKSLGKHLDHFAASGEVKELFTTHELFFNYHLGKQWHIQATVPMVNSYRGVNGSTVYDIYGMGDPWLLLRRQWVMRTDKDLLFISGGLGAKFPLGSTRVAREGEVVDLDMQPGSGSMDFLSNLVLVYEYKNWMVIQQNAFKWNGEGPDEYRYGNTLSSALLAGYKLLAKEQSDWKLGLTTGAYAEWIGRDAQDSQRQGEVSATYFLDSGVNLRYKNMVATLNGQIPFVTEVDDRQLPTTHRFITSLRYEL